MWDIALGYSLDLLAGDPYWFPHPVRFIGRFISFMEGLMRRVAHTPMAQRWAGIMLTGMTVAGTYALMFFLLKFALSWNTVVYHAVNVFFIYTVMATRCLGYEAMKIYRMIKNGEIESARHALSYIVGRDTDELPPAEIVRAVVETVAENASDGIVAPLFYLFIGGMPLAMAYKAVNTLDSMIGYKNQRYIHFGWAAARLDDIFNFLPARITAVLIALVAGILRHSFRRAFTTMIKEGSHHSSPNSGYPEAAMAGALGVMLGGASFYSGQLVEKPTLGQAVRPLESVCIPEAVGIMYAVSLLMLATGLGILWVI